MPKQTEHLERRAAMDEKASARRWKEENAEAIDAWNAWTETNGLPLGRFRQF